ncbi:hypothetical protein [Laspinema palackyanum]|uniref:hypothetical protein n=1 Tax=Laspinema palackyanum TaxID=3231601 RepID=UPI00345D6DB3|nr:hypothetical protein [Laspinema sp. D2c]
MAREEKLSVRSPTVDEIGRIAIAPEERCGATDAAALVIRLQPKGADPGWKPRPTYGKTN